MGYLKFGSNLGITFFGYFVFFEGNKLVILLSGFQKKTQKIPATEIKRAERLMAEYYDEKRKELLK